jgi:beta-lactamase class A
MFCRREKLPKTNYQSKSNFNREAMYEQYYYKDSQVKQLRPLRKKKKSNGAIVSQILTCIVAALFLFYVFPFAFKTFVLDIFPISAKKVLNIDYYKVLYPTHNYLYKDLFLGKYIIQDSVNKHPLMSDIQENVERQGLKNNLISLASHYPRIKPAVYVWEYNGKSFVNIDADEAYPAASIIKVPVLIEMFREIEQGKFTLEDTMVLEDHYRASGSGKLQYSQGGIAHSMDHLARIMIENSDNSATNMIIAKMGGMPELNRAMKRWGLKTTHVNNWLPDLDGTNVTTAREMAKMLYNIDTTSIVSNESKKHIADYLGHVKNNRLLQAGLPSNAILLHKTGDIGFMLGDAGIVKTGSGKKYIVVILARRPYNNQQGKDFIVEASKLIYNNLN